MRTVRRWHPSSRWLTTVLMCRNIEHHRQTLQQQQQPVVSRCEHNVLLSKGTKSKFKNRVTWQRYSIVALTTNRSLVRTVRLSVRSTSRRSVFNRLLSCVFHRYRDNTVRSLYSWLFNLRSPLLFNVRDT